MARMAICGENGDTSNSECSWAECVYGENPQKLGEELRLGACLSACLSTMRVEFEMALADVYPGNQTKWVGLVF